MSERASSWPGVVAERIRARLDPGMAPSEEHLVTSRDGRLVRLRRLDGPRTERPVILCHGLGGNSRSFDLPGCLGPFLASAGFDVFLLDLIGARLSDWQVDAVCAMDQVADATGSHHIAWIGHSIGGWLGLTAPFGRVSPGLVVGLGSTVFFERNEALGRVLRVARRVGALAGGDVVPQATLGAIEAPLMGHVAMPPWLSWISPPRLRGPLVRQLHALALTDIPLPIVIELLAWVRGTDDGSSHRRAAARTSSDVMLFAGTEDPWAPIASVERTNDLLNARPKGRAEVVRLEVGHAELLFGAERETLVFDPIKRRLLSSP